MKASVWLAPVAFVAIMFGTIGVAQATGGWVTSGKQTVTAGQRLTADDLKGWMTLQQASDGLGLPLETLIAAIDPPAGVALTGATAFKDLEALVPGFELTSFREVIRLLLNPTTSAAPTSPSAAPTSAPAPQPSATHTPTGIPTGTGSASETGASGSVTGQSTLRGIARDNGLDPAVLARESGLPADVNLDATLKTLRDSYPGWEIQAVRDAVARLGKR